MRFCVKLVVCFLVSSVSAFTHYTHSNTQHPLRGIVKHAHGSAYGYDYRHGTLDDDALDEWGSVNEEVDGIPRSTNQRGLADDAREASFDKGMTRDEGNMAFRADNPSTRRPGGTGPHTVVATQSSEPAWGYGANTAIDGNTAATWNNQSCTHTNRQADPWWKVDLGEVRTVNEVRLFNLGGHRKYKLEHIEVFVGDGTASGNKLCGERLSLKNVNNNIHLLVPHPTRHSVAPGGVVRVPCPQLPSPPNWRGGGLTGRYVTVIVRGANKVLHLCEVQVIGSLLMAPAIDQGAHRRYGLDQGGGVPIDPCAVDLRMQSSSVARLCNVD